MLLKNFNAAESTTNDPIELKMTQKEQDEKNAPDLFINQKDRQQILNRCFTSSTDTTVTTVTTAVTVDLSSESYFE